MGGKSSTTQTQQSESNPWAPALPALNGILGQLQGNLGNTGITANENNALSGIVANAQNSTQFVPQIQSYADELLRGGGAMDQAGNVNAGYQRFVDQTNPLASNTNYNPYDTPGFKDAINTTIADITNATNGQFAAAGRDFSGMNSQTLGRGIMQGIAPTIAAQYNQNVQNQQGAAGNLYNAGNTNAGLLSGLQQQALANKGAGVTVAGQSLDVANAGNNAILEAEAARRGIPVQALGLLAQIGIPIAGLGGTGKGTATGTQQMSGAQQFGLIANGIGNLMPKFPIKFG